MAVTMILDDCIVFPSKEREQTKKKHLHEDGGQLV